LPERERNGPTPITERKKRELTAQSQEVGRAVCPRVTEGNLFSGKRRGEGAHTSCQEEKSIIYLDGVQLEGKKRAQIQRKKRYQVACSRKKKKRKKNHRPEKGRPCTEKRGVPSRKGRKARGSLNCRLMKALA